MWHFTKWHFTKKMEPITNTIEPVTPAEPVKIKKDRFDITITLGCGKELGYNQIHEHNSGKSCIGCFFHFTDGFMKKNRHTIHLSIYKGRTFLYGLKLKA